MSDTIILAIIGAVVSVASLGMTLLVKYQLEKVHKQINSRMTELLDLTRKASKAEGAADNQAATDAKPQDKK